MCFISLFLLYPNMSTVSPLRYPVGDPTHDRSCFLFTVDFLRSEFDIIQDEKYNPLACDRAHGRRSQIAGSFLLHGCNFLTLKRSAVAELLPLHFLAP